MNKVAEQHIRNILFEEIATEREKRNRVFVRNYLFVESEKEIAKQAGHPIWDKKWDRPKPTSEDSPSKPLPEPPVEMTPTIPPKEKSVVKSPPGLDFVQKRKNNDRRLFRDRLGSIEERLQKAANKLDKCGETTIASKIDKLLHKLQENNNVRKKS